MEDPQSDEFFAVRFRWVVQLANTTLRPSFAERLPLNFHFVEDDAGNFNFLNIRRLSRLNRKYVRGGSFFHVKRPDDLVDWDGKRPLLLMITTQRGRERELIDLAAALPRGSVEVFVTFGYLSHPAILLREFGINVVPAYFDRDVKEIAL